MTCTVLTATNYWALDVALLKTRKMFHGARKEYVIRVTSPCLSHRGTNIL